MCMSCLHVFIKGPNKNTRCPVKPQKGSEYCGKHKKYGDGTKKPKVPTPNPEPEARTAMIVTTAVAGEVWESPGDIKVVEEVQWVDINAGYYDGDFWDQKVFVPIMDASGSDHCEWTPSEINY